METISWSQATCYASCPKKWAYRYIDKLPSKPSVAMEQGSKIHKQIEDYLTTKHPVLLDTCTRNASNIVDALKPLHVEVEQEVSKELDGLKVHGFVDAILEVEGGRVFIDWKTTLKGRRPKEMKEGHYKQLSLYGFLADANNKDMLIVSYPQNDVGFYAEYDVEHGESVFDWVVGIADIVAYMKEQVDTGEDIQGTPGRFECKYCDYQNICPDSFEKEKRRLKGK